MARSQENGTTILLGLKGYEVERVTEEEKGIIAEVKAIGPEKVNCPRCSSAGLYRHGSRQRRVLHSWSNGKKVYLQLHRQRWRCRGCSCSFHSGAELLRPYSRITRQSEAEVLWQLRERSFSQVRRELGVGYGTLRRLLEREIDEEALGFLQGGSEIFLGIDEHSFRHQELVHTITEVKQKRVLGILRDDRIATLKGFLGKISQDRVREVCIDMKEGLWKAIRGVFPQAKVVVDPFHVIADANRRLDEARRLEQEMRGRRVNIPKRVFLIGREKLREEQRQKVESLLDCYPNLRGFYWAKEALRSCYQQRVRELATKQLDNIILNLKSGDDAELVRWGNTLKHWREPILNHFYNGTTNGFTEGCHTKIKMLKRLSYGLRNAEVYWRKMLLGFVPSRSCFHTV